MTNALEQYVDPSIQYVFLQDPREIRSLEDARRNGVNCIALAHLAMESLFDYRLPGELHFSELYRDPTYFDEVADPAAMETGDLVWFGRENPKVTVEQFTPVYSNGQLVNWSDFPVKHVGIFNGDRQDGDPQILHASPHEGTNVVWSLGEFAMRARYAKIYGIRRLKEDYRSPQIAVA